MLRKPVIVMVLFALALGPGVLAQMGPAPHKQGQAPPTLQVVNPALGGTEQEAERIKARVQMFTDMGVPRDEALLLSVLLEGDDSAMATLLPLLMAGGGNKGDIMGLMLLTRAMGGAKGSPTALLAGNNLIVVDGGTVYKIDLQQMKLLGKLKYKSSSPTAVVQALQPLMSQARVEAQASASLSNVRQICLAMLMYAQDHAERLPGQNWIEELMPYVGNEAIFRSPAWPEARVGYVMNAAVVGKLLGSMPVPAQLPLLWEKKVDEGLAVGTRKDVPEKGPYGGKLAVGFVDGHAKLMPPDQLRALLK